MRVSVKKNLELRPVEKLEKYYLSFDKFLKKPPQHRDLDPHYPDCYLVMDFLSLHKTDHYKKEVVLDVLANCRYHTCNHTYTAHIARDKKIINL